MVELRKQSYTTGYLVVEANGRMRWFNPLRYTMALLALVSALSSIIIILVIAPCDHQFMALIISLCISIIGIIGSLKIDLLLSSVYCLMMIIMFMVQCRYYNAEDISVVSLTVPMLGWASINTVASIARNILQLLYAIAATSFLYAVWFNSNGNHFSEIILSPI